MKNVKNGLRYDKNGWIYVSVKGEPRERGYAYGYLIADEMKKVQEMLQYIIYESYGRPWEYFIEAGEKLLKHKIMKEFPEFYEEMAGIAEGVNAGGTSTTIDEIIAWNNYFTLTESWYANRDNGSGSGPKSRARGEGGGSKDRCSAFMANGDWTSDGKIVVAHNNFSEFIDGQYARVVLDLKPTKGARMLIQGFPGWIWSGTDFFVTSNGIIGTETTIGGFLPYVNNFPISCRIRKAMQYGKTLDDYVTFLLDGNSGDYANSWLFGDIHTNEILRIELGLEYYNIDRTKNGYFIGFNAAYDPRIRNLECVNTGFDDIRRHQGARRVRLDDLMDEHKGKIDIEVAKIILADHYDVYLNKENPCSRTVCSHYEMDAREYMSDPSRPKPYQPRGALDGNVCDSNMAKKMSFCLRFGDSCGIPFFKDKFCDEHREWAYLRPYLHDRPQQPWTDFAITNTTTYINNKLINSKHKNKSKKNTTKRIKIIYKKHSRKQ
jgi:hypothetical protein